VLLARNRRGSSSPSRNAALAVFGLMLQVDHRRHPDRGSWTAR
jgi:hypothetical protein